MSERALRLVLIAAVVLVAVGAFLLWGPIGLGNGPLNVQIGAVQGSIANGPVAFALPLHNSGGALAVVDGVELIGGTRFPGPRLLGLEVLTNSNCGGAWPARAAGPGFVFVHCGGRYAGPLIGHGFGPDPARIFFGWPAAAEAAAPPPGGCWVMTKVVVHYHVGIRHYAATDSYPISVCRSHAKDANAAYNAVLRAG
jgi:hypothetical protein